MRLINLTALNYLHLHINLCHLCKKYLGMFSLANKLITNWYVYEGCDVDEYDGFCVSRCEIEATLERLKRLERDLSSKEQALKERERRLKMWERKLIDQSNTPVSLCLSLTVGHGGLDSSL